MPDKAQHFCNWSGCDELTTSRYCEKHTAVYEQQRLVQRAAHDRTRESASKRGYDDTWQMARRMQLRRYPLCELCKSKGIITAAVLVHHIRPISDGGARLDPDNMMSLCNSCHEAIHRGDRWTRKQP